MATTKKKPITKKTSVTKKATVKNARGPKRLPKLTWRFYAVTIGIFLIAVTTVVVLGYITAGVVAKQTTAERLDRINGIYASLDLGEDYKVEDRIVFGDKRVYNWDKNRSYSSEINYVHGDTVSNTVAEVDAKVKAAGFTFIDEPYPNTKQTQYHYKSAKGEYIRLTVESKPYRDAFINASAMNQENSSAVQAMDTNAGPAYVTIKVNLDDNNE